MAHTNTKLKVGIIGCGNVAVERHLPMLKSLNTVQVVAAADADEGRLRHAVEKFGIGKAFTDYRIMLSDCPVDVVGIFVPLQLHFEVATAALQAQKHLLLEKPLTMTMEEAGQLIEQAARTDRKVMMGFNKRWHRRVLRARKVIEEKGLGTIRLINVICSSGLDGGTVPAWRMKRELGGGNLIEKAAHYYDICSFLLQDDIEEIYAVSVSQNNRDDEPAIVTARTCNGVFLNFAMSDFLPSRNEIEILGEDCGLSFSLHRFDAFELTPARTHSGDIGTRLRGAARFFKELPGGLLRFRYGGDYTAAFRTQWNHFIDCIQNDKPVACTLEDGRYALQITLAAVESAATGQPVKIEPASRNRK
jgi:predicted dehydrogenase